MTFALRSFSSIGLSRFYTLKEWSMNIAHKLAEIVAKPAPPPPGGFINDLPEAFGAINEAGNVFVIGYKGEWYHLLKPSLRVRIHNWLIRN